MILLCWVNGKILKAKYSQQGYHYNMSHFWKGVFRVKHIVEIGFRKEVGIGTVSDVLV